MSPHTVKSSLFGGTGADWIRPSWRGPTVGDGAAGRPAGREGGEDWLGVGTGGCSGAAASPTPSDESL